ncbi:PREDICTED: DNA-directed RNA polymerase [Prunus dulcis]|uniref:DNA-directed RNA polymerase n=1 Tax=Prunus dulcis TaxID=3755 RepID=A0A5E4GK86_PRUDU|nr:PREDICTED: DNA-directed RNA polymerase [Prunus dulcis]
MMAKGVLKEHLILLENSMTCAGNFVGFNSSGYKALSRALNIQVPFTEATLFTPRKCFERAAEKCHMDSLASIVASCSWGKHVAVGTGARFDVLWDRREVELTQEGGLDVFNFLHMVSTANVEEATTGALGAEVDDLMLVDEMADSSFSPELNSSFDRPVFEDLVEFDDKLGDLPEKSNWEKDSSFHTDSNGGKDWSIDKNVGTVAVPDVWSSWGTEKGKTQDSNSAEAQLDSKKSSVLDTSSAWGKNPAKENTTSTWGTTTASENDWCGRGVGEDDSVSLSGKKSGVLNTSSAWATSAAREDAASAWGTNPAKENTTSTWGTTTASENDWCGRGVGHDDSASLSGKKSGVLNTSSVWATNTAREDATSAWGENPAKENTTSTWGTTTESENDWCGREAGKVEPVDFQPTKPQDDSASLSGWDSPTRDGNSGERNHQWGQHRGDQTKKSRFEGAKNWVSSPGEWKNKNRPPKSPGMVNDNSTMGALYTVTRHRLDMFTSEEHVLSNIEPVMRSLRG